MEKCKNSKNLSASQSNPDSVRELCNYCFRECKSLRRVMFGSSSSLEQIGAHCFDRSGVEEMNIPDNVRELCDYSVRTNTNRF